MPRSLRCLCTLLSVCVACFSTHVDKGRIATPLRSCAALKKEAEPSTRTSMAYDAEKSAESGKKLQATAAVRRTEKKEVLKTCQKKKWKRTRGKNSRLSKPTSHIYTHTYMEVPSVSLSLSFAHPSSSTMATLSLRMTRKLVDDHVAVRTSTEKEKERRRRKGDRN